MLNVCQALTALSIRGCGPATLRQLSMVFPGGEDQESDADKLLAAFERARVANRRIQIPEPEELQVALERAQTTLEESERLGLQVLAQGDPKYPARLSAIGDAPPVLFVKGPLDALLLPCVAVVGTRKPSDYGVRAAQRLGEILGRRGLCVVSGLALGCDRAAHEGALQASGATAAVLAHGLDAVHPTQHRELAQRILDGGGCLVSEEPPGKSPSRYSFTRRNRIQSGLSSAVVVVEAGAQSGTMVTVAFAREQGRAIGTVVPANPKDESESLAGNRALLADPTVQPLGSPEHVEKLVSEVIRRHQEPGGVALDLWGH